MGEAMVRRVDIQVAVLVGLAVVLSGCATFGPAESPPGPGVPRIANLRFEPDTIAAGGTTQMSFYFEVGSADLDEGYLLDQGIAQFQFFTALQRYHLRPQPYSGQVAGVAEVPVRWPSEGLRWLELYVVNKQGNVSNRIRALSPSGDSASSLRAMFRLAEYAGPPARVDASVALGMGRSKRPAGPCLSIERLYRAARRGWGHLSPTPPHGPSSPTSVPAVGSSTTGLVTPQIPRGETDGPSGTLALARALILGLKAGGLDPDRAGGRPRPRDGVRRWRLRRGMDGLADASAACRPSRAIRWWPRRGSSAVRGPPPAALISIEKLGPNGHGVIHTMRGEDVTGHQARTDVLFPLAPGGVSSLSGSGIGGTRSAWAGCSRGRRAAPARVAAGSPALSGRGFPSRPSRPTGARTR